MLPIILQHVRELAEASLLPPEKDHYKIITPFPPRGPDFPDLIKEVLCIYDRAQVEIPAYIGKQILLRLYPIAIIIVQVIGSYIEIIGV